MPVVLGVETSCDETSAAVVTEKGLRSLVILSQDAHAVFGGVVPEIAARAHLTAIVPVVHRALEEAGAEPDQLDAVAVTASPGLVGALLVGVSFSTAYATALNIPVVPVHHMEGHLFATSLEHPDAVPPFTALLVSGGHTLLLDVEAWGTYRLLGSTRDDAAGEAFDKVAKLLGLGWPGGPALEKLAAGGDAGRYAFPRPLLGRPGCDFSFSGLKTAVALEVGRLGSGALPAAVAADIAASFQRAVAEVLADRAAHAMEMMRKRSPEVRALVVAGGVAANGAVRTALETAAASHGFALIAPPVRLCTDNAVMVAWAGIERLRLGLTNEMDFAPRPRWPLEQLAT